MKSRSRTYAGILAALTLAVLVLATLRPWGGMRTPARLNPLAANGVLDLRDRDVAGEGSLKLDCDWEFYWGTLLSPADLAMGLAGISGYTDPGFWNGYIVDGEKAPRYGCATYALRVLMNPDGQRLALRVPAQSTAFRLYMNGREIAANGRVGTNEKEHRPQYMPLTVGFDNNYEELSLVMQVSNFSHRRGGMWQPLELGSEAALRVKDSRLMLLDMLSVGSMLTMAFHHLLLYATRRKERSTAYFASLCLCHGLRALIVGEMAITRLWPNFDWATTLRLEYFASGGILPLGLLFLWEVYPAETSKLAVRIGAALYAAFFVVVAVFPTTVSSRAVVYFQVGSGSLSVYVLHVLISASVRKREGALWLSVTALFFIATLVNDMLRFNGIMRTLTLSSMGLVAVCYAQAYVLADRFSKALTSVEKLRDQLAALNQQLTELNRGLEQRVDERTAALLESNKRLEAINEEIERMEQSRRRLLANIAHDLRTPVMLIQGYVEAMLDGVIEDPQQIHQHLNLIAGKASGLSVLIADLFELSQLEDRRVTFDTRPIGVDHMVYSLYMKYEADINRAGVVPVLRRPTWSEGPDSTGPVVIADPERIDRVFSNLIYNALKFTPKGGTIIVSHDLAEPEDAGNGAAKARFAVVSVADTGAGISQKDLPHVFERFHKVPHARSKAPGSGLGLSIAREIVELHGGRIWAESTPGEGATFRFTLPLDTG